MPARAHSLAIEAAARTLDLIAGSLLELFAGCMRLRDAAVTVRIQDNTGEEVARMHTMAGEARHERIVFLGAKPDHGPLLSTLVRLRHDLVMIGRAAAEPLAESLRARLGPLLARVAETAADQLRLRGEALSARREPSPFDRAEAALDDYTEAIAAVRLEGLTRGLPADAVERILTLGFALDQMRQDLGDLDRCVGTLAEG